MSSKQDHMHTLNEIRSMMEKSSKFLSLSGLSGVTTGLYALTGVLVAYFYLDKQIELFQSENYFRKMQPTEISATLKFILLLATIILVLTLLTGFLFTRRKAIKKGLKIWDKPGKRMMISLLIPLTAGGIFSLALIHYQIYFVLIPVTLIFYGLALINASKYTLHEIQRLGTAEIIAGILALWIPSCGLLLWGLGFGIFHIVYGIWMYYKYER